MRGVDTSDEELQEILRVRWMQNYWSTTRSFGGGLLTNPNPPKIAENTSH